MKSDGTVYIGWQHASMDKADALKGFTLIEVMVAMTVISIVVISVFTLHSQNVLITAETQFHAVAPMLAQKRMSEIETAFDDNQEEDSGNFGEAFENYSWHSIVEDVTSESLESVADDLKKITVTVYLGEQEFEYTLSAYKLLYKEG